MRAFPFIGFEDIASVQSAQISAEEWAVTLRVIQPRMDTSLFSAEWIPLLGNEWGVPTLIAKEWQPLLNLPKISPPLT